MNKITIVNDEIKSKNINKSIVLDFKEKESLFGINKININVLRNTVLLLKIDCKVLSKLEIVFNIESNVSLDLRIITSGTSSKIRYKYLLDENSLCNIEKFNNIHEIKEMNLIYLNKLNSNISINFKSISKGKELYDYMIYHKFSNTISNIRNNTVNISGIVKYQVSTFIPSNTKGCIANQNNRIINLTDNKCEIQPNLYIDTNDMIANHSAFIGKFNDDEMFYLMSRGIDYNYCVNLLIQGFLRSNIKSTVLKENINKVINKNWR